MGKPHRAFVLCQPRQKRVPTASRSQLVRVRQGLAMLLHLVAAEQLRSQRWLDSGELFWPAVSAEAGPPMEQGPANGPAVHLQV